MRAAALNFVLILSFGSFGSVTSAQDNQPQSLGDVARQALAAKSSTSKSATVVTDDTPQIKESGSRRQALCYVRNHAGSFRNRAKDDGENDAGLSGRNCASPEAGRP